MEDGIYGKWSVFRPIRTQTRAEQRWSPPKELLPSLKDLLTRWVFLILFLTPGTVLADTNDWILLDDACLAGKWNGDAGSAESGGTVNCSDSESGIQVSIPIGCPNGLEIDAAGRRARCHPARPYSLPASARLALTAQMICFQRAGGPSKGVLLRSEDGRAFVQCRQKFGAGLADSVFEVPLLCSGDISVGPSGGIHCATDAGKVPVCGVRVASLQGRGAIAPENRNIEPGNLRAAPPGEIVSPDVARSDESGPGPEDGDGIRLPSVPSFDFDLNDLRVSPPSAPPPPDPGPVTETPDQPSGRELVPVLPDPFAAPGRTPPVGDTAAPGHVSPVREIRFCLVGKDADRMAQSATYEDQVYLEVEVDNGAQFIEGRVRDLNRHRHDIALRQDPEFSTLYVSPPFNVGDFRPEQPRPNKLYGASLGMLATLDIEDSELEARVEPVDPPIVTGDVVTMQLKIEGAVPDEMPERFEVELEARPFSDPDTTHTREALELVAGERDWGCELSVQPLPERSRDYLHRLTCRAIGEAPPRFAIAVPEMPWLAWRVRAFDASSDTEASGEWRGMIPVQPPDLAAAAEEEEPEEPVIYNVFPAFPQTGLDRYGGPNTHVPDADSPAMRHLLVIGKNLPQAYGEARITSDDDLDYRFAESVGTLRPRELEYSSIASGLRRLTGPATPVTEALSALRTAGLEVISVDVRLRPGTLPGPRRFTLNGAPVEWLLEYADTSLHLEFVRRRNGDEAAGVDALFEPIRQSYGDEDVHLAARVSPAHLNLDQVAVELELYNGETGESETRSIVLRKSEPGLYLSSPLSLGRGGAGAINLPAGEGDASRLTARVATDQIINQLPFARNARADLIIERVPDRTPWRVVLEDAAACSGLPIDPAQPRRVAFEPIVFKEGDPLANVTILNGFDTVRLDARVGHHAGLLFLRRYYLEAASKEEERLTRLLEDRASLNLQYLQWRTAFDLPVLETPTSPLFKVEIDGAPVLRKLTLGELARFDAQIQEDLAAAGLSDEERLDWIESRTAAAVTRMLTALRASNRELRAIDKCDVTGLLRFGRGLSAMAERAVPDLVRPTVSGWEPDIDARRWLTSGAHLADAWEEQIRMSEEDTSMALLSFAIVTLPISLGESLAAQSLSLAADTAQMIAGYTSADQRYDASRAELARAMGMSAVIGDARYNAAKRNEVSWWAPALEGGLSAVGLAFNGATAIRALRAERGARLLKAGKLPETLTPEQLRDLAVLRDELSRRARAATPSTPLSTEEQKLLRMLEDADPFGDAAKVARKAPETPPAPTRLPPALRDGGIDPLPTEMLSPAQMAVVRRAGLDAEGLPNFFWYRPRRAPTVLDEAIVNEADQAVRDAMDDVLRSVVLEADPESIEGIVSQQALLMLRDPRLRFRLSEQLQSMGAGQIVSEAGGGYLIAMNPDKLGKAAFGVRWHPTTVFVHESGHMAQVFVQGTTGKIVGRSLREFDSSLRMSLFQNTLAGVMDGVQKILPEQALRFSLNYAADVQLGAYKILGRSAPRFGTPGTWFNGLFQLDHTAAIARAKVYFPSLTDKEILDIYIEIHASKLANLHPDVLAHPFVGPYQFVQRYRDMVNRARSARAALGP